MIGQLHRRMAAGLLAFALVAAGCGGNVTESEEYLDLQDRFDEVSEEVDGLTTELGDVQSALDTALTELETATEDLSSAAADLAASEERVSELEGDLQGAEDRATAAEDALEEELNRPWPDAVKEVFVAGCASEPDPGFTAEEQELFCTCLADELEAEVSFEDFMVFSMGAFLTDEAAIDPITGFPEGLDEEFVETIGRASVSCAFRL